ncbi:hypothetical protein IFM89_008558 [Coptis chinensis]|uniref:Uncharacterized protein n=1 Tax=Coptis chinensis TaxID=261450 RepID=A0A835LU51_9MAGN|nr:hypothetical protein IFM89_008558 [Coptis chinensis]
MASFNLFHPALCFSYLMLFTFFTFVSADAHNNVSALNFVSPAADSNVSAPTYVSSDAYKNLSDPTKYYEPLAPSPSSFDYYIFALQWGVSVCNAAGTHCLGKDRGQPMFSIHGLWPSVLKGKQPSNCAPRDIFDPTRVKDLQDRLNAAWPDVQNLNNAKFWGEQWKKHGTCSRLKQHEFFEKALDLFDAIDFIQRVLALKDVLGNYGGTYNLQSMMNAYDLTYKVKPRILCNTNSVGKQQIQEFQLKISTNAKDELTINNDELKNCPKPDADLPL